MNECWLAQYRLNTIPWVPSGEWTSVVFHSLEKAIQWTLKDKDYRRNRNVPERVYRIQDALTDDIIPIGEFL